jgi:RNA polymerase sigma factor (sigma-70 family)
MTYNFDELRINKEIQKIGYKATAKFRKQLSKEEIDSCFLLALWKACKKYNPNYDPEKIASFYTFLYKGVLFECMKLCKSNASFKENINKIKTGKNINKIKSFYYEKEFENINTKDLGLEPKDSKLLIDRYWNNKTLKEISNENGVSPQAIKKRINKILKKINLMRV